MYSMFDSKWNYKFNRQLLFELLNRVFRNSYHIFGTETIFLSFCLFLCKQHLHVLFNSVYRLFCNCFASEIVDSGFVLSPTFFSFISLEICHMSECWKLIRLMNLYKLLLWEKPLNLFRVLWHALYNERELKLS